MREDCDFLWEFHHGHNWEIQSHDPQEQYEAGSGVQDEWNPSRDSRPKKQRQEK